MATNNVIRLSALSVALTVSVFTSGVFTAASAQNYYGNSYDSGYGQQQQYQQPTGQLAPLQGRVVTAPAGTYMSASVQSPITSEYARPGDRFNATLGAPVSGNGGVILPAGSQLEGQVVSVTKAGRAGRNGQLDIRFTAAVTPTGQRIPLSARIQTEDGSGIIKGGTAKGRAGSAAMKTAVGAGSGAALGTAMGALSGGSVGKGAIYGTAIGGGLGLLTAGVKKGDEAVINAGQPINIVLDTPVTASPAAAAAPQGYGYNAQPANTYGQPQYNNGYNTTNPYTQQQPANNNYYGSGY